MSRLSDLNRFYSLLSELSDRTGGTRPLTSLSEFCDWPKRGVYFFIDRNESRQGHVGEGRIVRVGTHALTAGSKSTLRQRLSQHRGTVSGGGNHRGSIFRLLVGQSLLARGNLPSCPSWGVKGDKGSACNSLALNRATLDALESPIEQAVSEYLASLEFYWLGIDDAASPNSLRGYIEQHSIALLSNHGRPELDPPTKNWLGLHSNRPFVRTSGLWNQRHVEQHHDSNFLDCFEDLITATGVS